MIVRCLDLDCRLADYLENELPPHLWRAIQRHIAECPRCAREVAAIRNTVRLVQESFQNRPQRVSRLDKRVARQTTQGIRRFNNFVASAQLTCCFPEDRE
jgi:anti-sigma factor RsiW